jgi:hypothetical protein
MTQGNPFMLTAVEHSNHRYDQDTTETRYEMLNIYVHGWHGNSTKAKEWIAKSLSQTNKKGKTEHIQNTQMKNHNA